MLKKSKDGWFIIGSPCFKSFLTKSKSDQQVDFEYMQKALKSRDAQIKELLCLVDELELKVEEQQEIPLVRHGKMLFRDR